MTAVSQELTTTSTPDLSSPTSSDSSCGMDRTLCCFVALFRSPDTNTCVFVVIVIVIIVATPHHKTEAK